MKKINLFILSTLFTTIGWAQTIVEDFNYPLGQILVGATPSTGWIGLKDSGTDNPFTVNGKGLSYTGSPSSGIGLGVNMASNGQDVGKFFKAITTGSVYMSFFVNVSEAFSAGANFAGIMNGPAPSPGIAVRSFIKSSGKGFVFGIQKVGIASPVYETTERKFGTTYLLVLKYTFNTGSTNDDIVDMWVNPTVGAAEATAQLSLGAGIDDAKSGLTGPCFIQRTPKISPICQIDGIRVGTTWAFATPSNETIKSKQ